MSQLEAHLRLKKKKKTQHIASSPRHTIASWRIVQRVKSASPTDPNDAGETDVSSTATLKVSAIICSYYICVTETFICSSAMYITTKAYTIIILGEKKTADNGHVFVITQGF